MIDHLCLKRYSSSCLVIQTEDGSKNLLRTALGVVKTKSAARQYESRVAELWASGGDVGDYSHSKTLFVDMLKVACTYIDKEISLFLEKPLRNTGLAPHFYVTTQVDQSQGYKSRVCYLSSCGRQKAMNLTFTKSIVHKCGWNRWCR